MHNGRPHCHKWTDAETAKLFELRDDEGMEFEDIAAELGLPTSSCNARYYNERRRRHYSSGERFMIASPAAILDREKRDEARRHLNLTASIFGDPPPGYSALDKRRANA